MQKPDSWERGSSKQIADCRVFRVRQDICVRDSDGRSSDFFVVESPDWVNIIALNASNEAVLIEQFRHGTEETILELPGGLIDEGEAPDDAAHRELLEETGYSSQKWILLGRSHLTRRYKTIRSIIILRSNARRILKLLSISTKA